MNPGVIVSAVLAIALLYVIVPVAVVAYGRWRRPWRLTCPRAGTLAQIRVDALRAALAEPLGRRPEIERCSLWPMPGGCAQECLDLPPGQWQAMRRGEAPPRARRDGTIRLIVVPLDGTSGSEAVLSSVGALARGIGASVRLLRVVPPAHEARDEDDRVIAYSDQESERVDNEARTYLRRAAVRLGGVPVQAAVRVGTDVTTEVVEESEAAGADLIALAAHRRSGLDRVLEGGVARRLQQATTIPLLLVPYDTAAVA